MGSRKVALQTKLEPPFGNQRSERADWALFRPTFQPATGVSRALRARSVPGVSLGVFLGSKKCPQSVPGVSKRCARYSGDTFPEGPARHLDASRQKLAPHCLAAIFDSQIPSQPNCILKCLPQIASPPHI